jgi:hypothetical protein
LAKKRKSLLTLRAKKSEPEAVPMWQLNLRIASRNLEDTRALAASLATDCEVVWQGDSSFSFHLEEGACKDLRAMWNTRLRGLIATDNVLKVFGKHS